MDNNLDPTKQHALQQLRDLLTNTADDEVLIGVLSSVGWDVQHAAEMIFGSNQGVGTTPSTAPIPTASTEHGTVSQPSSRYEEFDIDDSMQGEVAPAPSTSTSLLTYITYPFHIFASILRFLFSVLRIPLPHIPFLSLNIYRPLRRQGRRPVGRGGGPDRWVRELEEETGAVCISRSRTANIGVASGSEAGPSSSNLTSRVAPAGDDRSSTSAGKLLPDFTLGTYDEALRICQKESRVGCIILVSEEHDDVAEFKRATLTDPTFVNILTSNDFVVWGGDVLRDIEAYSASEKLQATTYPFVAFVALQPPRAIRSSSSSSSAANLTVLSRHQGPPTGPTSASTLSEHLTTSLLPRVLPYLQQLQQSKQALEHERLLRQQQDQAFADSARKDTERILRKMEEERRAVEEKRRKEEEERRRQIEEEERRKLKAAEAEKRRKERAHWRRWSRKALIRPESAQDNLRVAIRMPDGKRIMKKFSRNDATLTELYSWVDAQFIPSDLDPSTDPALPPPSYEHLVPSTVDDAIDRLVSANPSWWTFTLVNSYPRKPVPWQPNTRMSDVECLSESGGGHLVVEMFSPRSDGYLDGKTEEVDGYDTEESGEE